MKQWLERIKKVVLKTSPVFFAALAGAFIYEGFLLVFSWRILILGMVVAGAINVVLGITLLYVAYKGYGIRMKISFQRGVIKTHDEQILKSDAMMAELLSKEEYRGFN